MASPSDESTSTRGADHPAQSRAGSPLVVALRLPGMTLNGTIFPSLGIPHIDVDFCERVVSPDGSLPTHAPGGAGGGMPLFVRWLRAALADDPAWAAERRIVVGHSFGGMLAMAWQSMNPSEPLDRVDGMVLVSATAGPMFDVARVRLATLGRRSIRIGVNRFIRIWNRPRLTRLVKRLHTKGSLRAERVDFRSLRKRTDWAVDAAGWRNTDWRTMRTFRLAMAGFDVRNKLDGVRIPTIVIHGTDDTLFPVDVARDLVRALPQAELRLVPGAGHALPLTHGHAVIAAVRDVMSG
jgi:pimeloyl-ACP methyl ester carboxylesterase